MPRTSEGERRRKDPYYKAAKKAGYRSRSAFKIRQMAKNHKLLHGVDIILDLCSAPGGWTQILHEINASMKIVAIDLEPMLPVQGTHFIQGSILDDDVIEQAQQLIGSPFDLVLSDCSPKVSGLWDLDVARQLELAKRTYDIAHMVLGPKGKALAKVFQGQGFQEFLLGTKKRFNSVKLIKPAASRKTSAEIYLLAIGPRRKPRSKKK
jgi:23S rRNA (uridine2552-2'-O)-methyltransferase